MDSILLGRGQALLARLANRHGLIAGATGTGKTVTLQRLAEGFSRIGVPVFMADVKGDLSGIAAPGKQTPRLSQRLYEAGLTQFEFEAFPASFWGIDGSAGIPLRTTISEMGPLLLARLLALNETQSGLLNLVFEVADDQGMLLLDLKDLRAMLRYVGENAARFTTEYGTVSRASIGAIQRALLELEQQGGEGFFGEPALAIEDLMQTDATGRGIVNILAADRLIHSPKLYSTFLLWLLAELFEQLPEVGDSDRPKLVFFFDEAHLLFADAPTVLQQKIEQVVRLIRSKGVGVYFVTQSPQDIPESVLGQLGNRVQHALRAFTPKDQRAVRAAAETFRASPGFDATRAITELGVGEALVSLLDEEGRPRPVERVLIYPPHSQIGALDPEQQVELIRRSPLAVRYRRAVDRESAYEILKARAADSVPRESVQPRRPATGAGRAAANREKGWQSLAESAARSIGTQIGRQLVRGVLGALRGGGSRRR